LPYGTEFAGLELGAYRTKKEKFRGKWQESLPMVPYSVAKTGRQPAVVGRGIFPARNLEIVSPKRQYGIYTAVVIHYYPIQINLSSKELIFTGEMNVRVKYKKAAAEKLQLKATIKKAKVAEMFDNAPDTLGTYQVEIAEALEQLPEGFPAQTHDYIIATTNAIEENCKEALDTFVAHKESLGYSVKIVTEDDCSAYAKCSVCEDKQAQEDLNPFYPSPPALICADQLRTFLTQKYFDWGIKYLLIIGSANADIEMKLFCGYSDNGGVVTYGEQVVPTDVYLADVNSSWDSNGNGVLGEYEGEEGDYTDGHINGRDEIAVGRIPSGTYTVIAKNLQDFIDYENETLSGNPSWRSAGLLAGAILEFDIQAYKKGVVRNGGGASTTCYGGSIKKDAAQFLEDLNTGLLQPAGYSVARLYEGGSDTLEASSYASLSDLPLNETNLYAELQKGPGFVVWFGHGKETQTNRILYTQGDSATTNTNFINCTGAKDIVTPASDKLSRVLPLVWAISCLNGYPDSGSTGLVPTCLRYFAICGIGSTRLAFGSDASEWESNDYGEDAAIMAELFLNNILNEGMDFGTAMGEMRNDYFDNYIDDAYSAQNYYTHTLYGDPSLCYIDSSIKKATAPNVPPDFGGLEKKAFSSFVEKLPLPMLKKRALLEDKRLAGWMCYFGDVDHDQKNELIIIPDRQRSGMVIFFEEVSAGHFQFEDARRLTRAQLQALAN
jgi:hypothetical protein